VTTDIQEPKLPPTATESGAISELLKLNPKILEGAMAHAARVTPSEPVAPQMTPQEVQSAIDKACGRMKQEPVSRTVPDVEPPSSKPVESVREQVLRIHQSPTRPEGMEPR
jgi:hypothetical protein